MKNDLPCNIIKDLLPIYLDGIASMETNTCIVNHLNGCQSCQEEYKRLCEAAEKKNQEAVMKDFDYIKALRKRIIASFLTITIIGISLIGIAMFCDYAYAVQNHSNTDGLLALFPLYASMYFLPPLAILVAIIWKKTIFEKEKTFRPNVIVPFLGIVTLVEVVFLLRKFLFALSIINK